MALKPQRQSERLHHELLVAYQTIGEFISAWAVNISKGGLFVNTPNPLPVGSVVKLKVSLPDAAFPCDLTGRVTRIAEHDPAAKGNPGMALEFIDVDDEKRLRLERFVEKLRAAL